MIRLSGRRAPAGAPAAYAAGLRLLSGRELSARQIRERLEARGFEAGEIDAAVDRLRRERALDDRRTALAFARTAAVVKGHGRIRILRDLQALGIDRDTARQAVGEVFADVDEPALLARALGRKLHGPITTPAEFRRLYQQLVRHGFAPEAVRRTLEARARGLRGRPDAD